MSAVIQCVPKRRPAAVPSKLSAREHEVFALILLDRDRRLIDYIEVAQAA